MTVICGVHNEMRLFLDMIYLWASLRDALDAPEFSVTMESCELSFVEIFYVIC